MSFDPDKDRQAWTAIGREGEKKPWRLWKIKGSGWVWAPTDENYGDRPSIRDLKDEYTEKFK
jgi:hypothetical protein